MILKPNGVLEAALVKLPSRRDGRYPRACVRPGILVLPTHLSALLPTPTRTGLRQACSSMTKLLL